MSPDRRERLPKRILPPEEFLHPRRGTLPEEIPMGGPGLLAIVDAPRSERTLAEVAYTVRTRYPETAGEVDAFYTRACEDYQRTPDDPATKETFRQVIARVGAYIYGRGLQVFKKRDPEQPVPHDEKGLPTANVERDRNVIPKMTLSPSALWQLQQVAHVSPEDDVLYTCSGAGGGIFFTAAESPRTLTAVDIVTPYLYDLPGTVALGREEIYANVPDDLQPHPTEPTYIQGDAASLPRFETAEAQGFNRSGYNKIFCHPPYGRESALAEHMEEISEGDGFLLWVNSILSANQANQKEATVYSIIPPQWMSALGELRRGEPLEQVIPNLYAEVRKLRYYENPKNAAKLTQLDDQFKERFEELGGSNAVQEILTVEQNIPLREMGQFPLHIAQIHIPGTAPAMIRRA